MDPMLTRRGALVGGGLCALAVCGLASCASYGPEEEPNEAASPASGMSAPTSDIPVGGGKIYADESVVVTQPTEGDFKCFTAVCTHQGCLVSNVDGGTINCTCHGSMFSIEDGSVEGGPAPSPLDAVKISVEGDSITLA